MLTVHSLRLPRALFEDLPSYGVSTWSCAVNRRQLQTRLVTLHVIATSSPAHALNVHHPGSHVARAHPADLRRGCYSVSSHDSRFLELKTFLERPIKLSVRWTKSKKKRKEKKNKDHSRIKGITCCEDTKLSLHTALLIGLLECTVRSTSTLSDSSRTREKILEHEHAVAAFNVPAVVRLTTSWFTSLARV